MDGSQALRSMVEASGLTHAQIEARASRYGGWVGQTLARSRPGSDLVAELAHACGYRLELVPMGGGATITIGDHDEASHDEAQAIDQARALIARAAALLDGIDI